MKKPKHFVPAKRETERDSDFIVQQPTQRTEFEVQAYLWSELRNLNIEVHGECKAKFSGRAYVRFDLAVFESGQLAAIIEVKRKERNAGVDGWLKTRQGSRYSQFGVPVINIFGLQQAEDLITKAKNGSLPWG